MGHCRDTRHTETRRIVLLSIKQYAIPATEPVATAIPPPDQRQSRDELKSVEMM